MTAAVDFAEFLGHTITVETRTGDTGQGPGYAAPVTLTPDDGTGVLVDETVRQVPGDGGVTLLSKATVYDPDPTHVALYTPGSRVTLPGGRVLTVQGARALTAPAMSLPDHVEVSLT